MSRTKKAFVALALAAAAVGGTSATAFADNHSGSTPKDGHAGIVTPADNHSGSTDDNHSG